MIAAGHALCPAISLHGGELNSPKRHYILIPSGFYKARMAVEVDFFMID